jgi:putative ABC transport system permease protein
MEQGLIFGLMALGVYLSFRVLNYADLSVDGSLPLGAAIAAVMIINGHNPWVATFVAIMGGTLGGIVTGILHTRFKITALLSGILTMTALYSVNLRVMKRSNLPLLWERTIFTDLTNWGLPSKYVVLIFSLLTISLIIFSLYLFLNTEIGLALRATGDNEQMIISQGVNINGMKLLGLGISNALVALSGAYVAQHQGFADVGMGIGTIIAGLASVIIGEVIFGQMTILRALIAVVAGSVLYRLVIAVVLQIGLTPTDLKLMTAILVIIALASPEIKRKFMVAANKTGG